jgi:hypothetical protein
MDFQASAKMLNDAEYGSMMLNDLRKNRWASASWKKGTYFLKKSPIVSFRWKKET